MIYYFRPDNGYLIDGVLHEASDLTEGLINKIRNFFVMEHFETYPKRVIPIIRILQSKNLLDFFSSQDTNLTLKEIKENGKKELITGPYPGDYGRKMIPILNDFIENIKKPSPVKEELLKNIKDGLKIDKETLDDLEIEDGIILGGGKKKSKRTVKKEIFKKKRSFKGKKRR